MHRAMLLISCLVGSMIAAAQPAPAAIPVPWQPQTMPMDRVEDSYAIYSSLLPLGETASWKATYYAVADTTITAVQPDERCAVPTPKTPIDRAKIGGMNPHGAVSAPADDAQDYAEVMNDFDSHCHERLSLTAEGWNTKLPVRLLSQVEQDEFRTDRFRKPAERTKKYEGSPSLYSFSQVYFNAHHTVALVYATHVCGGLCGQGFWIAFRKNGATWKRLPWNATTWIS